MIISLLSTLSLSACPPAAACAHADGLLSVAATPERAESVLATALDARERFTHAFGRRPGDTAIVEDLSLYPGYAGELRGEGFIVKPWISPAAMREALAVQMRPALRQALPAATDAEIEARITPILDQRLGRDEKVRHAEAIIAHELGHLWFIDVYDWPEHDSGERVYGAAAAPDWLDETAAVSLESDALTADRRAALCARLPEDPAAAYQTFFATQHPLLNLASRAADAAGGEGDGAPRIMVLDSGSLDASAGSMSDAGYYYLLARNLVDWAEAEAGGMALFAAMAETISSGGTVEGFLAAQAPETGAPADMDALGDRLARFVAERCARPL